MHIEADAPFLLRLQDEEHPWVAVVIGQAGNDFGLLLLRGPRAFTDIHDRVFDLTPEHEAGEEWDMLSVSFEPWSCLDEASRKFLTAAGFHSRREHVSPVLLVKRPGRLAHLPGSTDTKRLLASLRAFELAQESGAFSPRTLDERDQRVLEVAVMGSARDMHVDVRWAPWPELAQSPVLPIDLSEDLKLLERCDESWFVTHTPLPASISTDDRTPHLLWIVREDDRKSLLNHVILGNALREAVDRIESALRGTATGLSGRLPARLRFAEQSMLDALGPSLERLGVDCQRARPPDWLADGLESLIAALEAGPDAAEPEDLEGWKTVEQGVLRRFVAVEGKGNERALARYFGSIEAAYAEIEASADGTPIVAFAEWKFADYRATSRSKTALEKVLASKAPTPAQRVLLEARRDATLSLFRVDACERGASLDVEDVLSGERLTIQDRALSGCGLEGFYVPLRILRVREWRLAMVAGPGLGGVQVSSFLSFLESAGVEELNHAGMRANAAAFGRSFAYVRELPRRRPTLRNTDDDALEDITATFLLADPAGFAASLASREDMDADGAGTFHWTRPGGPVPGFGTVTLLGRIDILDDRAVLEVNSRRRFETARDFLVKLPGVHFERVTEREVFNPERPVDDQLPEPPSTPDPELISSIQEIVERQYLAQLDLPVPGFGGRTPREYARSSRGRDEVARWVRTMPPIGVPGGSIQPPRDRLLRELGLA